MRQLRRRLPEVRFVTGDLLDQGSLISAVERVRPDEVYNLAAISYVPMSWQQAELTGEVTGLGVLRVLEAMRVCSGISASRSPGQDEPADFVIGAGVTHSVADLLEKAFRVAGLDWRDHVVTDAAFVRPAEADTLCADPAAARDKLGWQPKIGFDELVGLMVEADPALLSAGRHGEDLANPNPNPSSVP